VVILGFGTFNSCGKNAHVTGSDFPLLDQSLEGPNPNPSTSPSQSDGDTDGDGDDDPIPSPSPTQSGTPTHSPSGTPTHSPSGTPTHSPSASPSASPSPVPSHCVYKQKKKSFRAVHHALLSKKIEAKIEFPESKYFGELLSAELKTKSFGYDVTSTLDKAVWKKFYREAKPIGNHYVKGELEFYWDLLESCHGDLTLTLTWTELVCSVL
jgi:hypothetical protein